MMSNEQIDFEIRKSRALRRLGTDSPACAGCGNSDWRCLELHHVAGQAHDDMTAIFCRNCHRVLSDDQRGYPAAPEGGDAFLIGLANFLMGLADAMALILDRLRTYAVDLLERAKPAPSLEAAQ